METTYEVKVQTQEGVKTVTVSVDNSQDKETTLVDILSDVQTQPAPQPVVSPAPYSTKTSVTSEKIYQTSSDDKENMKKNPYLTLVKD